MNQPCPHCHGTGVDNVQSQLHCLFCHGTGIVHNVRVLADQRKAELEQAWSRFYEEHFTRRAVV